MEGLQFSKKIKSQVRGMTKLQRGRKSAEQLEKAIIEQSKYKEIQELEENKLHAEEYVFDNYDMSMKLVEKPKSQKSAFSDLAKSYHPPKQNFQESRFYDEQEISQREADLKSL